MKLTELNPLFVRYETRVETYSVIEGDQATWRERGCPCKDVTGPREYAIVVPTLAEAQGIRFDCPKCGNHGCEVTFEDRGVLPSQGTHKENGDPVRWKATGSTFDDLSTIPSVQLIGGCAWHGFITNGEVTQC